MESEETLQLGDKAPDFNLKNVDGKNYSLDSFDDAKALLVIFMCNHCPYVKAKIDGIKKLHKEYRNKGLVVVGINSNESENYPEDSFENMVKVSKVKKFNFYYLHDETQEVAKAYGAVCTPDPFLFNEERKLVYHGRLNNAMSPYEKPTKEEMNEVVEALLGGKEINFPFRPSQGCSIKWKQ